jgi:uncharacterized protein (TIGR02996 family)
VTLQATRQALESGAIETALALALEAWRQTRAPVIADAIDRLDERWRRDFVPPKARTKTEFQGAWLALAEGGGVGVSGWLAETLTQRLHVATELYGILDETYPERKFAALPARLAKLAPRQPDPRIAAAAVELVVTAPILVGDAVAAQLIYGGLLQLVTAAADVRGVGALQAVLDTPRAKNVATREFLTSHLPPVIAALRAVEPLLDEQATRGWRALAPESAAAPASPSALDGAQLLAQIRARPDDDSLRLVYADWLLEHGDPLGELIVLQDREARGAATAEEQKRGRALVRAHKDEWLGPLALVLRGVELERGFLARAELAQNAAATEEMWNACAVDERLATLRELRQGRGNVAHYSQFVLSPAAHALTAIEVTQPSVMELVMEVQRPLKLTTVYFKRRPHAKLLGRMIKHPALAGLRTLRAPFQSEQLDVVLQDLEKSGWLLRLDHLILSLADFYDRRLIDSERDKVRGRAEALPPSLRRVTLVNGVTDELLAELRP